MAARSANRALALNTAAVDAWLEAQSSANTRAAYRADLQAFGRWCADHGSVPICADTSVIVSFHAAREAAGDSASTLRRRWSSLSSFYQFAIDADLAGSNPVAGARRPQVATGDPSPTAVLSPRAVEEYLAMAAALDPRLDALVSLLVHDGLKLGEALAIDVDDLSGRPPRLSLMLRRNGVSRRIRLSSDSAGPVARCAGRRAGEPLFTRARPGAGQPSSARPPSHRLTRFGADHLLRQLSAGGDARVTANALRRFHLTASHAAGTDLDEIRDRAGLADVRSLRRYLVAASEPPSRGAAGTDDEAGAR